jgi:hypothetical protein
VVDEVDEAPQLLGVDLHVVAVGAAAHGAAGPGARLLESGLDVLAQPVGPLLGEGPLPCGDAVLVQVRHVPRHVDVQVGGAHTGKDVHTGKFGHSHPCLLASRASAHRLHR